MLIGSDYMWYFFTGHLIRSEKTPGLVAIETIFGWVVGGSSLGDPNISSQGTNSTSNNIATMRVDTQPAESLDDRLKQFWDLETLGICEADEKPFFETFTSSIKRNVENRYEVKLPFKNDHPVICDNYELSKNRLLKLHDKLSQNPELMRQYDELFQEQARLGIIEPAEEPGRIGETSYLPHRAVIRDDKETTKVRVVFDASAKEKENQSLNDCLMK